MIDTDKPMIHHSFGNSSTIFFYSSKIHNDDMITFQDLMESKTDQVQMKTSRLRKKKDCCNTNTQIMQIGRLPKYT